MDEKYSFKGISILTFASLLNDYDTVVPETLAYLEHQRLAMIPEAIRSRNPAYFTKDEIVTLMDWKLAHGKFRPALKKLVRENQGKDVQTLTETALKPIYSIRDSEVSHEIIKTSVSLFAKLRGVGPATASLLLSTYDSEHFPFFSDELFCWAFWNDREGWKKRIKYDLKEYMALFEMVEEFQQRYKSESGENVSALDVEKVAYVLRKQYEENLTRTNNPLAKEQDLSGAKRKSMRAHGASVSGSTATSSASTPLDAEKHPVSTKRRRRK